MNKDNNNTDTTTLDRVIEILLKVVLTLFVIMLLFVMSNTLAEQWVNKDIHDYLQQAVPDTTITEAP